MITAKDIIKKHKGKRLVLTASRRTDIPAFHLDYFITGLKEKKFLLQPPMRSREEFSFEKDDIHSVGVWSQNFEKWIEKWNEIKSLGYNFWYRFTILPDDPYLKPRAPGVKEQLVQLEKLIKQNKSADTVFLFIDPLVVYQIDGDTSWHNNYSQEKIEPIFEKAAVLGIRQMTVSMVDYYKKIDSRCRKLGIRIRFFNQDNDLDREELKKIAGSVKKVASRYKIRLKTCCEKLLNDANLAEKGSCVDGRTLNKLFGDGASILEDKSQRRSNGCGCTLSLDIGSYSQYCSHGCPQCYAGR